MSLSKLNTLSFKIDKSFVDTYKNKPSPFANNAIGEVVYYRTYSRVKPNGENEQWYESVERVVNGTFSIMKNHIEHFNLEWNDDKGQEEAKAMYDCIFEMRFLPPGRGLWCMGAEEIHKRGLFAALNNCAFISTKNIDKDSTEPFTFLCDSSMLGLGCGYDCKGADKFTIVGPDYRMSTTYVIPDSRQGWIESIRLLLKSHFEGTCEIKFDYSEIRPLGVPLKGMGGLASGPEPLENCHKELNVVLDKRKGWKISSRDITDIMNILAKMVVSGNLRRSATISFGEPDDEEFLNLKNYDKNPERISYGWASNNSIFAELGMDYSKVAERIKDNGEPGFLWLENARKYSRMCDPADNKDRRVAGCNPCLAADSMIVTDQGVVRLDTLIGKQFNAIMGGKNYPSTDKGFWKTAEKAQLIRVTLENGYYIRATSNHLISTIYNSVVLENTSTHKRWTEVGELKIGQEVQIDNFFEFKSSKIVKIEYDGEEDVYDCTIPDLHCFIANRIVVHNCVEQSLESGEICNLVECFPNNHKTLDDFKRTLKYAFMYGKVVTLTQTHWPKTNRIILRNRRIGCSLSGIVQFLGKHGLHNLKHWLKESYDEIKKYDKVYSEYFAVPQSIKVTSIKPSGSVSLLANATSGMHYPISRFYIRRVRISTTSALLKPLIEAGYKVEKDFYSTNTTVIEFPCDAGEGVRGESDVSMWEQLSLAETLQGDYSDNQVSATITFDPEKEGNQIEHALNYFQYKLKGVSFLPRKKDVYQQMPLEQITEEQYREMKSVIKPVNYRKIVVEDSDVTPDKFCSNDTCLIPK